MDLDGMLAELRAERDLIDSAMEALERFSSGRRRGRGRPPKWLKKMAIDTYAKNGRDSVEAAALDESEAEKITA